MQQQAGTKRKYKLISKGLKEDVKQRDSTIAKLTNEKAERERKLEKHGPSLNFSNRDSVSRSDMRTCTPVGF